MNLQSSIVVTLVVLTLIVWLLKIFVDRRISSGQAIFWLCPLIVAAVLALFPSLIDRVSVLWGNLVPVSWITFSAMVFLIFYLLYLTIRLNRYNRIVDLARSVGYLEQRLRETESKYDELRERVSRSE